MPPVRPTQAVMDTSLRGRDWPGPHSQHVSLPQTPTSPQLALLADTTAGRAALGWRPLACGPGHSESQGSTRNTSSSAHWSVWPSITVTIAISSLLRASVSSSVKVLLSPPPQREGRRLCREGHSTPQHPHMAFSLGTFESVGSESPIGVFRSVTKIKYQTLSTVYHFYRLRAGLRRLPQQQPFHLWLSNLPSWVARERQSIEGAGMVGVPGEPARSGTASTQPPPPHSSRAAPW